MEAHLLLGDVYLDRKKGSQALEHYQQACELTTPDSLIGREARLKLSKWRSPLPEHQVQGWGETLRRMCGLMLIPSLAALVNAGMIPWRIKPVVWSALVVASAGAYLWVCATDVPRNPAMRDIFYPGHPSVIRMVNMISKVARIKQKPLTVCGEIASEPHALPLLIGLGVDQLSVHHTVVPRVKAIIRELSFNKAQELARKVLRMETATEVETTLSTFHKNHFGQRWR